MLQSSAGNEQGRILCRSLLSPAQIVSWTSRIDGLYRELVQASDQGGPAAIDRLLAPGQRFVSTASSFTIEAVGSDDSLRSLLATICTGPAGAWMREELQGRFACDRDQSWVRRQHAPGRYPRWHAPHGWHQDGALGFDFRSSTEEEPGAQAVLPMVTCWVSLDRCGIEAPGLELVICRINDLLTPKELTDERLRMRFAPEEFWRPVLEPGDALLFRGDLLHRTYVTPPMIKDRTSIELRFFPEHNLPTRLGADRFLKC
jgi:hypothetical protein